jgi:formamidopyrimidine-DNA glycosylase
MPELPEVETVKCGLKPHIENKTIQDVTVRHSQLRWPIPADLKNQLTGQLVIKITRRGKYLLLQVTSGTLIIHLGMSGSLRVITQNLLPTRHDHVDIVLSDKTIIRYNDPRRFGAILWTANDPFTHPLLQAIGIEPLDEHFTGHYLQQKALKRHAPIKSFLMNSKMVAGIGNIYAAEALFLAKIHPMMPAHALTITECDNLVHAIKQILHNAIESGGTTLKDFVNSEGKPGYFSQNLQVYGRAKLPCKICATLLESFQLGQRSTVFCGHCQPVKTPLKSF